MSNDPTVQCAFRFPKSLVDRIDAFAEGMSADQPGMVFTRADAVRILLVRALEASEKTKPGRHKR